MALSSQRLWPPTLHGGEGFPGICIPLQPLQIGPKLGGGLAANVAILLQSFVDDPFEFAATIAV
jgi:hypothetical protein